LPAPEIASLQPPQKYQPLRDDHARAAKESVPKPEKQEAPSRAPDAQQEPQPHRSDQLRASTGRATDSGGMVAQQALANDLIKQNRATAPAMQTAPPVAAAEKLKGKDRLAADLAKAKQGRAAVNQERDTGQAPPAKGEQKDNPPAAAEKQSGKDRLAADLARAKEGASARQQGRGQGRSR
jgi:hypothetical protein